MNTMRMDTVGRKRVPAPLGLALVWLSVWLICVVLASTLAASLGCCAFARIVALRTEAGPRLRLHLTVVGLIALIAITHRMLLAMSS